VILVSNNRYRLGNAVGAGTRLRMDEALLGVTVMGDLGEGQRRPLREWTAATFEVDSEEPVAAGIDGEAVRLQPPLRFGVRPGVLRVRVATRHPGASPSAALPGGPGAGVGELWRIAVGRDSTPSPARTSTPATNPKES
jgi:hypothetical protein